MAGLSTKAIKTRIKSMQSTRQITKAMELVAASKLRSAQAKAISSRPYFQTLYAAMDEIADTNNDFTSPYLHANPNGKPAYVVIAGDRGLAGGYNNNVLKLAFRQMPQDAVVLPIGKKTVEFFQHRFLPAVGPDGFLAGKHFLHEAVQGPQLAAALAEQRPHTARQPAGKQDRRRDGYEEHDLQLAQTPAALPLLPLTISAEKQTNAQRAMIYEGGSEAVFNAIVPEYLGGVLYGALCESTASEQAARRMAMDAASKNADEIIENLNLQYNRARQGAITQEITEIVAGSEN